MDKGTQQKILDDLLQVVQSPEYNCRQQPFWQDNNNALGFEDMAIVLHTLMLRTSVLCQAMAAVVASLPIDHQFEGE